MTALQNPLLAAIAALPDADLDAAVVLDVPDGAGPDLAAWLAEVGFLLAAERAARHGATRPTDTNALSAATRHLTRDSLAALLDILHRLRQTTPDGPQRRFITALGFMLALSADRAGAWNPEREN